VGAGIATGGGRVDCGKVQKVTTIAYRKGVLAADTRETDDEQEFIYPGHARKIHRLEGGHLFAAAGDSEQIEVLRRSVVDGSQPPKMKGVEAIVVLPSGRVRFYEGRIWSPVRSPFFALGTGKVAALAAMYANASAAKAVRIAMKLDFCTGGRVETVKLKRRRKK
jgi:hypothetical protein